LILTSAFYYQWAKTSRLEKNRAHNGPVLPPAKSFPNFDRFIIGQQNDAKRGAVLSRWPLAQTLRAASMLAAMTCATTKYYPKNILMIRAHRRVG